MFEGLHIIKKKLPPLSSAMSATIQRNKFGLTRTPGQEVESTIVSY